MYDFNAFYGVIYYMINKKEPIKIVSDSYVINNYVIIYINIIHTGTPILFKHIFHLFSHNLRHYSKLFNILTKDRKS